MRQRSIGVVAGVGPFAGLDLLGKILSQTTASKDQDHLTVFSVSRPSAIPDRTAFLLDESSDNPAHAIAAQLRLLERMGARVAAVPCNTSHALRIFDVIVNTLRTKRSRLQLLHMPREVGQFLKSHHPKVRRVGVLATTGTYHARIYEEALNPLGLKVMIPDRRAAKRVYDAIYDIKAKGRASRIARHNILRAAHSLLTHGAEAIILGCTELPLAVRESQIGEVIVIDSTLILARALVREARKPK